MFREMFREYTDDEVLAKLTDELCIGDAELFGRWMKIKSSGGNYNDLKGGNVYFTGGFIEENEFNKKN